MLELVRSVSHTRQDRISKHRYCTIPSLMGWGWFIPTHPSPTVKWYNMIRYYVIFQAPYVTYIVSILDIFSDSIWSIIQYQEVQDSCLHYIRMTLNVDDEDWWSTMVLFQDLTTHMDSHFSWWSMQWIRCHTTTEKINPETAPLGW